jgi:MYXO-CTERM domain-containing protein
MKCRAPWEKIAPLIGADTAMCDVSSTMADAGIDAGSDAAVAGLDGGGRRIVDASQVKPGPTKAARAQSSSGCTVAFPSGAGTPWWLGPVLMLVAWMRRRRIRQVFENPLQVGRDRGDVREEQVDMLRQTLRFTNQVRACCMGICAFAWMGAVAAGCSSGNKDGNGFPAPTAGTGGGNLGSGGISGGTGGQPRVSSGMAGAQGGRAGQAAQAGSASMTGGRSGGGGTSAAGSSASGNGGAAGGFVVVEAKCGPNDNPEKGLQGAVDAGTVNCGLTLLAEIPGGGDALGSGHCAYVRGGSSTPYGAGTITAYNIADPLNPVMTDMEPGIGGSESMRGQTVEGRAILVSGSGVYDVSNCEDIVKKGEIPWPSENAMNGIYFAALSSHEIAISHDAMRVYSGLGFAVAHIEDLEHPETWKVNDWACEMNKQSGFPQDVPNACDGPVHQDVGRQYSHSSDDNLEGTVWYGGNQNGDGFSAMEPATTRMVDITDPNSIKILDTVHEFPGHSMAWWRTPSGREFIIGANEGGGADSCVQYPRPTNLGNDLDAYIAEVTGNKFGKPFTLTLDINKPENCQTAAGNNPGISEYTIYNKNGAAFIMMEFGSAGLRVFDLRDGEHPREVAYYNDGNGHVHSGVFYYDEARGIMLASGSQAAHVLMLQPQMIAALGLPTPTDPKYPYE